MMNLWNLPGVPHKGWTEINAIDLREDYGDEYVPEICEMCDRGGLRYVYFMSHPGFEDLLGVGSTCAAKMQQDYTEK